MEGLKLIDLGNEVSYIDVDTSKVPYTFSVKLGDRTFAFSIRYNEVGGFFTVDLSIASTGEVLVYGDIVRYGRPLFNSVEDERFPVPVIMPLCLTGDDISEVTFENVVRWLPPISQDRSSRADFKIGYGGFTEADFYPPIVGKDRLFESRFETSRGTYLPPVIEGVYPDTVQTATMAHEGVRGAVYHTHLKPRRID